MIDAALPSSHAPAPQPIGPGNLEEKAKRPPEMDVFGSEATVVRFMAWVCYGK